MMLIKCKMQSAKCKIAGSKAPDYIRFNLINK